MKLINSETKMSREVNWGLSGGIFWFVLKPGQLMNTSGKTPVHSSDRRKTRLEKSQKI